jgi:hypothetical protein
VVGIVEARTSRADSILAIEEVDSTRDPGEERWKEPMIWSSMRAISGRDRRGLRINSEHTMITEIINFEHVHLYSI